MAGETVVVASNGDVTRPALDRPDKPKAFTVGKHAQPRAALDAAAGQSQCRVVVLTDTDRPFCAVQDLAETRPGTEGDLSDAGSRLEQAYNPLVKLITSLEKPIVCAVNGIEALGPSAEMDLARDLQRMAGALPDVAEGIGAFLEKRAPKFTAASR